MDALTRLGPLFAYPDDRYAAHIRAAGADHPAMARFAARAEALGTTILQEQFTATFDLNPAAALEIGWHLFGEQYERGPFLVMLRERLRAADISEAGDLPDHLRHVLPLAGLMAGDARAAFVTRYLTPALDKIGAAVPDDNPFADLLRAARELTAQAAQTADASGAGHD